MPKIHWRNPISGGFTNPADWKGGVVPGASDDAILDAVGGDPYTVTASADVTVRGIETAADASLLVSAGTFTALTGTGKRIKVTGYRVPTPSYAFMPSMWTGIAVAWLTKPPPCVGRDQGERRGPHRQVLL